MSQKKPSQILSYLYLGGKSDAKAKDALQKLNIKYILNCTPQRTVDPENGCPNFFEKDKLFIYKRIPIFDNQGEDILSHMETAFKFIEEGKHYGNILVHCHKGISRSASFVIGYLMRKNELTFEEALAHLQMIRPMVQPNASFIIQLQKYQPNAPQLGEYCQEEEIKINEAAPIGPQFPSVIAINAIELEVEQPCKKRKVEQEEEEEAQEDANDCNDITLLPTEDLPITIITTAKKQCH